ncbi:MAG: hypothetical protein WCR49_02285 [Opitutae bacterium]
MLKIFVDVFNAYDQANAIAYNYAPRVSGGVLTVSQQPREMLPIIPSAGISWEL